MDVEAYIGRELIGGFRKLFHPPVPVHPPKDPVYAESEIFVDPYPVRLGLPTTIGALVFNPTDVAQQVTVTFGVAHFGIGMPFTTTNILTPTMVVNIPPHGRRASRRSGSRSIRAMPACRSRLQSAGHEPVYSQRNIDVGEPLRSPAAARPPHRSAQPDERSRDDHDGVDQSSPQLADVAHADAVDECRAG